MGRIPSPGLSREELIKQKISNDKYIKKVTLGMKPITLFLLFLLLCTIITIKIIY